ncbi:MAG: ubiquinone/menaquinone biosynthesis methyltransferase [Spirochaetes bacterium]|nr:MAG: ubiquinone/menaquinone biosynthesis methyltransferase [Spirochaetota bacterium]
MSLLKYEVHDRAPGERKRFIRDLFDAIVPTYDRLNRILSLGIDTHWRKKAVRLLGDMRGKRALDLCCGTGDVSRLLARAGASAVSLDFSLPMVLRGIAKGNITGSAVIADASVLPFADARFSALTVAFGIRNIPDLDAFMDETLRVLEPGGVFVILELTRPRARLAGGLYSVYLTRVLPFIGGIVSGKRLAYRYLAGTIGTFFDPVDLAARLRAHGYGQVDILPLTLGIATIMVCGKSGQGSEELLSAVVNGKKVP